MAPAPESSMSDVASTSISTGVLASAHHIATHSTSVRISISGIHHAAQTISTLMRQKNYSPATWSLHPLHPSPSDGEATVDFIFTMDLLNFSFWSERPSDERFAIDYQGEKWTGYWSLVAALRRAVEEGVPITSPAFWRDREKCTEDVVRHVFRSATEEDMPLLKERVECMRQAGTVLYQLYSGSITNLITSANKSAITLVNTLAHNFPCFNDTASYSGRRVYFLKRAQIFVADLWACFEGKGYGEFQDISEITMFADYRIPQMLHTLRCLEYTPELEQHIRALQPIASGDRWELELRGCSIWAVELVVQAIRGNQVDNGNNKEDIADHACSHQNKYLAREKPAPTDCINAILVDFFLYDTLKEREAAGEEKEMIPHHRTRSIWY